MKPIIEVSVNGQQMGGPFFSRLVSVTCTDNEGVKSDTCRIELNDGPEAGFLAIPEKGAKIRISMGYGSAALIGEYVVDEINVQCLPYMLVVNGKSADLRRDMKTNKARHWDDATIEEIVDEIAGEHGLSASVDPSIGSYTYEWIGQLDESDIHFLERLASRHNGLFSVKNGRLILADRGAGTSPGGRAVSAIEITPSMIVPNSCRVSLSDRSSYKRVAAYFQDRGEVRRKEITVESDPEGDATYSIGEPFGSEGEAEQAAASKAKALKRASKRLSVNVIGTPAVTAGGPVTLRNVRPGIDGDVFIVKTARHSFSKGQGYLTGVEAELKV